MNFSGFITYFFKRWTSWLWSMDLSIFMSLVHYMAYLRFNILISHALRETVEGDKTLRVRMLGRWDLRVTSLVAHLSFNCYSWKGRACVQINFNFYFYTKHDFIYFFACAWWVTIASQHCIFIYHFFVFMQPTPSNIELYKSLPLSCHVFYGKSC